MYQMRGTLKGEILKAMTARTEDVQLQYWESEQVREGRGGQWFTFADICEMLDRNKTGSMRRAVDALVEFGYIREDRLGLSPLAPRIYSLAFRATNTMLFCGSGTDWHEFLNSTGVWWHEVVCGHQQFVVFPAYCWLDLLEKLDKYEVN